MAVTIEDGKYLSAYGVLSDADLSAKAKGVLSYLISREGEHMTMERLVSDFQESEPTMRKTVKELEESGYLERERYNLRGHAAYHWRVILP